MKFGFLALFLCTVLAVGCSTANFPQLGSDASVEDFLAALKTATVADLDAATARAIKDNDPIAAACYPVLKKYVGQADIGKDKIAGIFDGLKAARGLARNVNQAQVPDDIKQACYPLILDSRNLGLRLASQFRRG